MDKQENSKQYDLEDRTLQFGKNVRKFIKKLQTQLEFMKMGNKLSERPDQLVPIILRLMNP